MSSSHWFTDMRVRHALEAATGEFLSCHVRSRRLPYWTPSGADVRYGGHVRTTVVPIITSDEAAERAAEIVRAIPGVIEAEVVPGDYDKNRRPLVYVYWEQS